MKEIQVEDQIRQLLEQDFPATYREVIAWLQNSFDKIEPKMYLHRKSENIN